MVRKRRNDETRERRAGAPTGTVQPCPVAQDAAAGIPGPTPARRWAVWGAAVLLVLAALWLPGATTREVRAQLLLREARREQARMPGSLRPETNLRKAYALNPNDPEVVFDLALFLVQREKTRFSSGQYNLIRPENFEEASALLERSEAILPFRPSVARLRGESEWMLAAIYTARGDSERASEATSEAFVQLEHAARLLPRPRLRNEDFNLALMQAAAKRRQWADALERLHLIGMLGQRGAMYGLAQGYDEQASLVWIATGMYPQAGMELRYRLEADPANTQLLLVANNCARDLGLRTVVVETLESLSERGRLDENGLALLQVLNESHEGT